MKYWYPSLFGLLVATFAAAARADLESVAPGSTTVSGFGTLGGVYNSSEKYGFIRDLGQETPPGRQYSWRTDTRLGVQVAQVFSPQWQAIGQVLIRDQVDSTLNNSISRAFVSWRPTANLHVRLGRMADATFLMSDYLDVGYAYPWVRPPVDSYAVVVPRFYDGVDTTYSIPDASGVWRVKGLYGMVKAAVPTGLGANYNLETNDARGLALIREQGPLKVRVGYSSFHLKNAFSLPGQLLSGLNQVIGVAELYSQPAIADEARSLVNALSIAQGARIGYASAGFGYDDGSWVAQVEANRLSSETRLSPRGESAYLSLGHRTGEWLPYVTVSGSRAPALVVAETSWAVLGPDAVAVQNGALVILNSARIDQRTLSLGVRWDFNSQAALKLQLDHVRVRNAGWRAWSAPLGQDGAPGRANLLSATIDFVF
jgi:hypothetical protein